MCDRCKKEIEVNQKWAIHISHSKYAGIKKKWDLCARCYRLLEKGIAKGTKENVSNN